ncbi:MAG: four-helix bundle copper-binding protein [Polyangiaceae bacterium]
MWPNVPKLLAWGGSTLSHVPRPRGFGVEPGTVAAQGLLDVAKVPEEVIMAHEQFMGCIEACNECAALCEHCATECLSAGKAVERAACIRLARDCADICRLAAAWMERGSSFARQVWEFCASVCQACALECDKHEELHCQACAEACRRCMGSCRTLSDRPQGTSSP